MERRMKLKFRETHVFLHEISEKKTEIHGRRHQWNPYILYGTH